MIDRVGNQPNEFDAKANELAAIIRETLVPLITSDYVLLDSPYHSNVGDLLIWKGEQSFFEDVKYRCLHQSSYITYREDIKIAPTTTILLHGGGNFGDMWRVHSEFRLRIVEKYPDNPIIILPQTVHYQDQSVMARDSEQFARHKNLTICARDEVSYSLLTDNFKNHIVMVPDMAFYIDREWLRQWVKPVEAGRSLYLRRIDHELAVECDVVNMANVANGTEVRDWPIFEQRGVRTKLLLGMLRVVKITKGSRSTKWFSALISRLADSYARRYLNYAVRSGVEFLSPYENIETTRLHTGILAILLGKECEFIDNSYGKNSAFYLTWLSNLEGVKMENKQ